MRYILIFLLSTILSPAIGSEWPAGLVQSTFDRCSSVGGNEQCRCVVIRLQDKFTFEDMRLSMTNKLAKEAISQMIRAFTVKCLGKEFKDETFALKNYKSPGKTSEHRFR